MSKEELIDEFIKYSKELMYLTKDKMDENELKLLIVQTKSQIDTYKYLTEEGDKNDMS